MADVLTPEQRHKNMAAIHSSNTKPEVLLRRYLWHAGFRYRINDKKLPGKPDLVLPKYKTVIFVHGCFWHGHKGCRYYTIPKTNTDFWVAKIERNQARDQKKWRQLEAMGWSVIIVWECQLKKAHLIATTDRVIAEIKHNGELYHSRQENIKKARLEYQKAQKEREKKENAIRIEVKSCM